MKSTTVFLYLIVLMALQAFGQSTAPDKRAYGVLPNYRTVEPDAAVEPLSAKEKFVIASKDSFDWPIFFVSGALSGIAQSQNSNPGFGQGFNGYAKRYGAGYADQAVGNFMTEAILPAAMHLDPRYFRRGTGSGMSRTVYALSRVLISRTDSGHNTVNVPELLGNASVTALGNLYYKDGVNALDNGTRLSMLIATDALGNVLKEFWPDVKRKWFTRHRAYSPAKP